MAALEMYLKNDMKAKFVFLNDLEAAIGFTSTMMTQDFGGSTTVVPDVSFFDYFKVSCFAHRSKWLVVLVTDTIVCVL